MWQYDGKLKMNTAEDTYTSVLNLALFAIAKTSEQEKNQEKRMSKLWIIHGMRYDIAIMNMDKSQKHIESQKQMAIEYMQYDVISVI